MNETIRFGPSGNSALFYEQGYTSTAQAPAWIRDMGLSAFEYSFGRGVRLSPKAGAEIKAEAQLHDIQMSVHLPYFINLATKEPEKRARNAEYFIDGLSAGRTLGAVRAVFHPGSAMKQSRETALASAIALLHEIIAAVEAAQLGDITLCPETMGKLNQLGSLDEVIALCQAEEQLIPCLDFGHLYCRAMGALVEETDFAAILNTLEQGVGMERARCVHIHFSPIEYAAGGERRHRTLSEGRYGPLFHPLARQLTKRGYTPIVICESAGTMAEDAAIYKEIYETQRVNGKDL